jgi:Lrp/AsnC family transcriptional regulator
MDAIDQKILAILQEDASLSVAEIAFRVGLSQTPCWKRIQKLEATGVVKRRVALLSPEKLGLGLRVYVSIVAGEHSQAWFERFAEEVSKMPEVVDFDRMAGDIDYMLCVVVPDIAGFDEFYRRLVSITPLRKVVSRFTIQRLKTTTALPLPGQIEKASRTARIAEVANL